MRYFKVLDDNNYITAIGVGDGGVQIDLFEYNRIKNAFSQKPKKVGYNYHLTNNCVWESEKLDTDTLSDEVVRQIFVDEILNSIEVRREKPRSNKEGYILQQVYDSNEHAILWEYVEDPNYVKTESGTYIDPIVYTDGMEVEIDKWYTDGDNIWECIQSGVPNSFEDREYFDIIG